MHELRRSGQLLAGGLVQQTFWLVLLAGGLGFAFPQAGKQMQGVVLPLLALMVIGIGVGQEARTLLGTPGEFVLTLGLVLAQLSVLPLAAFGVSRVLPAGDTRLGLLVVGLAPAEITSALTTLLAGGAAGLALRVLTLSLMGCTVTIPLGLRLLAGQQGGTSSTDLFTELLLAVVVPLAGALLLRRLVPRLTAATKAWSALSALAVVLLIFIVAGGLRDLAADQTAIVLVGAVILVVGLDYGLGGLLGWGLRLPRPRQRAVLFTTGMREFGVAAAVTTSVGSTTAGAVAAIYGVVMMSVSFLVVSRLRNGDKAASTDAGSESVWSCPAFVDTKTLGMIPREGVHDAEESLAISGGISRRSGSTGAAQREEHRRGRG